MNKVCATCDHLKRTQDMHDISSPDMHGHRVVLECKLTYLPDGKTRSGRVPSILTVVERQSRPSMSEHDCFAQVFGCNFWKGENGTRVVFEVNHTCAECRWFHTRKTSDGSNFSSCGRWLPGLMGETRKDERNVPVMGNCWNGEGVPDYAQTFGCNFWEEKTNDQEAFTSEQTSETEQGTSPGSTTTTT